MMMNVVLKMSNWRLISSSWSSWKWFWGCQRRPPKLLRLLQALLFLHVLLLPSLVISVNCQSGGGGGGGEGQEDDLILSIPMTTELSAFTLPQQRITISSSYSHTNYKAGLNSNNNNNYDSDRNNTNNSHININSHNYNNNFNSVKRHLILTTKDLKKINSNRRNRVNKPRRNNNNKPARAHSGVFSVRNLTSTTTTTTKPTMHPLRVLQTEISTTPAKIVSLKTSTPAIPIAPARPNLENHRFSSSSDEMGRQSGATGTEQYLTDEIKAQLALINRGMQHDSNGLYRQNDTQMNPQQLPQALPLMGKEGRSGLEFSATSGKTATKQRQDAGKSISENPKNKANSQFSNYFNTYTDNIAEEDHQYEVTELVNQYPVEYENHSGGKDDKDDEQDRNQIPGNGRYGDGHRHHNDAQRVQDQQQVPSAQQQYHEEITFETQRPAHHHHHQQLQQQQQQQQQQHHHYHRRPHVKGKRNRPKLNSYYDQNYYSAASPVQSEPGSSSGSGEQPGQQYEYKKHKEYHYYQNGNNYHGNEHNPVHPTNHYMNPQHGPYHGMMTPTAPTGSQQYYHQQQQQQQQQPPIIALSSPYSSTPTASSAINNINNGNQPQMPPTASSTSLSSSSSSASSTSSSSSSTSNSRHPAPQPYRGEHDNDQSADTIMDRFEVFYTEYKLLAWVCLFGLISLGFIILITVLYLKNPPTEVVTARSMLNHYLSNDPGILKFLSNVLDETYSGSKKVRRRQRKNALMSVQSGAKEL